MNRCSRSRQSNLPDEQPIHRDHPFHTPPDFVAAVRSLINRPDFQSILGPPQK